MKIILFLFLSVISITINAQEKKEYWGNGNLKSITNYKDGKKDGEWETFYEDGQLKEYKYYENEKKAGNWREFYFNGELKRNRSFSNGFLIEMNSYYVNGVKMVTGSFVDVEKKHGNWQYFYDNWQLKQSGDYTYGNKTGKWKFYTKEGNLIRIENYEAGFKTSKWEISENKDQVVTEATRSYYGDRLDGEWKFYNDNEKCIEVGSFIEDKKDGLWKYYYDNGQLKKEQIWKEGRLLEVTTLFTKEGVAIDRGTLKDGYGTVKEYNLETVTVVEYADGKVIDWNDYSRLNSLAWDAYENENDKKKLANAILWVKRSIELDKNYYNSDTYAALLYKTGNYKEALQIAQEAIEIGKKDNEDFSTTTKLIEEINSKLKK